MAEPGEERARRLWRRAFQLALFTVLYNLLEGLVSVTFGVQDEVLTLFGFGADSFVEVASGAGILAMVLRIRRSPDQPRSTFERTALRITGACFYALAAALALSALAGFWAGHRPETTVPGLVISALSIAAMGALVRGKRRVGSALGSAPLLADASCTMVCIAMSVVLLASSLLYALTGFGWADSLGAVGLAFFSAREGREALAKAASMEAGCGCGGA